MPQRLGRRSPAKRTWKTVFRYNGSDDSHRSLISITTFYILHRINVSYCQMSDLFCFSSSCDTSDGHTAPPSARTGSSSCTLWTTHHSRHHQHRRHTRACMSSMTVHGPLHGNFIMSLRVTWSMHLTNQLPLQDSVFNSNEKKITKMKERQSYNSYIALNILYRKAKQKLKWLYLHPVLKYFKPEGTGGQQVVPIPLSDQHFPLFWCHLQLSYPPQLSRLHE